MAVLKYFTKIQKFYYKLGHRKPPRGLLVREDLRRDDIALKPHFEEKTCDRYQLKTIIRLMSPVKSRSDWWWFSTETGHRFLPQSVALVRCQRLQDLLVLQGTKKSTWRHYWFNLNIPLLLVQQQSSINQYLPKSSFATTLSILYK